MAFCHFANLKCRALSLSTLGANKEKTHRIAVTINQNVVNDTGKQSFYSCYPYKSTTRAHLGVLCIKPAHSFHLRNIV